MSTCEVFPPCLGSARILGQLWKSPKYLNVHITGRKHRNKYWDAMRRNKASGDHAVGSGSMQPAQLVDMAEQACGSTDADGKTVDHMGAIVLAESSAPLPSPASVIAEHAATIQIRFCTGDWYDDLDPSLRITQIHDSVVRYFNKGQPAFLSSPCED